MCRLPLQLLLVQRPAFHPTAPPLRFPPVSVVQLWYPLESGAHAPYQVKLNSGKLIYVPRDAVDIIRAAPPGSLFPDDLPKPALRFAVGDRVMCHHTGGGSFVGMVTRQWYTQPHDDLAHPLAEFRSGQIILCAPYQIKDLETGQVPPLAHPTTALF